MPKKGHTEEQIITALKQHESGDNTVDICRKLAISQATFYLWKRQYAGLGVQELREVRQLREENTRLTVAQTLRLVTFFIAIKQLDIRAESEIHLQSNACVPPPTKPKVS